MCDKSVSQKKKKNVNGSKKKKKISLHGSQYSVNLFIKAGLTHHINKHLTYVRKEKEN